MFNHALLAATGVGVVVAIVAVLIVFMLLLVIMTRIKTCPSDKVLVVHGKIGKNKDGTYRSAKCMHGGVTLVVPFLQKYTFLDLSDEIPRILTHWEGLGLTFDFIYSGYLGNISQIETVLAVKRKFLKPNGKFIVDPVMGDGGKLYAHFDYHFVEKMRSLCDEADFILPNVTEACLLSGESYPEKGARLPAEKIVNVLRSAHTCPIVTGVDEGEENAVY